MIVFSLFCSLPLLLCSFHSESHSIRCDSGPIPFVRHRLRTTDTRETSFVSAITAAGITYALTRACTSGDLVECSCDKNHFHRYNVAKQQQAESISSRFNIDEDINMTKRQQWKRHRRQHHRIRQPSNRSKHKTRRRHSNANTYLRNRNVYRNVIVPDGDWQWGGCGDSDNVMFGFRKSKEFLDARYQRLTDIRTLVKLHNNNAGRLVSSSAKRSNSISVSFAIFPFFEFFPYLLLQLLCIYFFLPYQGRKKFDDVGLQMPWYDLFKSFLIIFGEFDV